MTTEKIKSLKSKRLDDDTVIAIVSIKDWFTKWFDENRMPYFITENHYVVCTWLDYNDGITSHGEAKTTIAIFRDLKDAELIFNSY